jgi:hypothetical protein
MRSFSHDAGCNLLLQRVALTTLSQEPSLVPSV